MKCTDAKRLFSPMLDSLLDLGQTCNLDRHLNECEACAAEFASLRRTKWLMATMAPHAAPPQLALRLNDVLAQQIAARRQDGRQTLTVRFLRWSTINAYMLPATGGLLSAVLIFGLLIGVLVPARLHPGNDVPTMLYTPPEMTAAPFGLSENGASSGEALLVEAVVDPHGRVQDYRVLNSNAELSPEMKNALIFTQFRPATSFGVPTSGRVVISFSNINVGG
jgi:hypothetical protein